MQPPTLDAGEASGRRRRDLRSSSCRLLCFHFASTVVSTHTSVSLRRNLFGVSRSSCPSPYRSGFTGSEKNFFGGVPHPVDYSRRTSSTSVCCYAYLSFDEYPPLVGVDAIHPCGVAPHLPDPSSAPSRNRSASPNFLCPQRFKKSFSFLPPLRLISISVVWRPEPITRPSPALSYLLTRRHISSAVLSSFLRGHFPNFLRFFTEAGLHITPSLSYAKSLLFSQLPMGSSGRLHHH